MNARYRVRNARGEWYVLGQIVLVLLVLLAPIADGKAPALSLNAIDSTTLIGTVFALLGFAFAVLGSLALGRNLSPFPRPKEGSEFVESGVFSIVRHPIYTGLSLLALGYSLLWASVAALVATAVLFVFLDIKARREEQWLEEKFDAYARYKARVRKLVPFIY